MTTPSPMLTLKSMFQRLAKLFHRPPVRVVIVHRDISRITLDQWRSNPDTVKMASKHTNNPEVRQMIDVLRCSAAPHNALLPLEATMEARGVWQARIEGYNAALNDFESLGVLVKTNEAVEATYEPPETTAPETAE